MPGGAELSALPEDIVALRASGPRRAGELGFELREAVRDRTVAGITDAGEYVLVPRR